MLKKLGPWCRSLLTIRKFRKISGAEVSMTELIPHFTKRVDHNFHYKVTASYDGKSNKQGEEISNEQMFHFDAHYRFILHAGRTKENFIPIACIAFDRVGWRTILIKQIQGPSYDAFENQNDRIAALIEIKWERFLVRMVCEWAAAHGFRTVQIISCTKSEWYRNYRHHKMFMRYDVTARRMGFKNKNGKRIYTIRADRIKSFTKAAAR